MLCPTPKERLVDARGRPYFLWDCELTLDEFRRELARPEPSVRAYWLGKLMRQAKPDDVFQFTDVASIEAHWSELERYLGNSRPFWTWLLERWRGMARAAG